MRTRKYRHSLFLAVTIALVAGLSAMHRPELSSQPLSTAEFSKQVFPNLDFSPLEAGVSNISVEGKYRTSLATEVVLKNGQYRITESDSIEGDREYGGSYRFKESVLTLTDARTGLWQSYWRTADGFTSTMPHFDRSFRSVPVDLKKTDGRRYYPIGSIRSGLFYSNVDYKGLDELERAIDYRNGIRSPLAL